MVVSGCNSPLCNDSHAINSCDVSNAPFKMKARKADGTNNIQSNAVINSSPSMAMHILLLFSAMLRHGVSPDNILLAILILIPKSTKKCLNDSTNYRANALSSLLSKLLDIITRDKCEYVFCSSESRFCFKSEHSTPQCTFVWKNLLSFIIVILLLCFWLRSMHLENLIG